jgi:glycogen debranching enzyme
MPAKDTARADLIEVGSHFYIRAQSSLADDRTRVLLHGDTFAVFDRYGDIQPIGSGQQGIFHEETRYLSRLELRIGGLRPLLLSSTIREDNVLFGVDLTNPDLELPSGNHLARGTIHIYRTKFLADGACFERITVHNFGAAPADFELSFAGPTSPTSSKSGAKNASAAAFACRKRWTAPASYSRMKGSTTCSAARESNACLTPA